jgi:hypothetical protein
MDRYVRSGGRQQEARAFPFDGTLAPMAAKTP